MGNSTMTAICEQSISTKLARWLTTLAVPKASIAAMALALSGCSSLDLGDALYLHSDTEEKLTADAVTALEEARTEHLKMLDDQAAFLTTSSDQIQQTLIEAEIAQRDAFLAVFVDKLDLSGGGSSLTDAQQKDTIDALLLEIEDRVHMLMGDKFDKSKLSQLSIRVLLAPDRAQALDNERENYSLSLEAFGRNPGAKVENPTCDSDKLPILKDGLSLLKDEVIKSCLRIQSILKEAQQHPAFFGVVSEFAAADSQLGAINGRISKLQETKELQEKLVKEANKALSKAQKDLKDAKIDENTAETKVKNVACALSKLATGNLEPTEDPPTDPKAQKTCNQLSFDDVAKQIRDGNLKLAPGQKSILGSDSAKLVQAAFRAARAEAAESSLVSLFDEVASINPGGEIEQDGTLASRVQSITRGFGLLLEFKNASSTLGANALAITAAGQAFIAQSARAESAQLTEKLRLLRLKRIAMSNEVAQLAFAYAAIQEDKEDKDAIRALRHYTESWNQGRIQQRLISYLELDLVRSSWLSRERLGTEARYAVLKPALDELAVFGAGGIEPELIARYLELIGISAIAVGTN